jgi:hypothetical protein
LACEARGDWRNAPSRVELAAFIAASRGGAVDPVER